MWDLPRPGLEPVSPALAGRFSTTAPPGKPRWPHLIHLPSRVYPKVLNYQYFCPSPPPPTTQPLSPLIHNWLLTGLLIGSLFSIQQTGPSLHISFHHQLPLLLKACQWFPIAVGLKCIRPTKSHKIWPHLPSASVTPSALLNALQLQRPSFYS